MPPRRRSSRRSLASTNTEPSIERPQSQLALLHPTPTSSTSTNVSSVASAPSSRCVRGPTVSKGTEKLFQQSGKLLVEVPADCNMPVSPNSTNKDFKKRSTKAKNARAHLPYNRARRSRSFPLTMSIMAAMNNDEKPNFMDLCKDHWSMPNIDWADPKCKELHEEFVRVLDECPQPDLSPMSQEEISIRVLGARSGYSREFAIGPKSSSSKSTAHSLMHDDEVSKLRKEISILKSQNAEQAKKFEDFRASVQQLLMQARLVPRSSGEGTSSGT